MGVNTEKIRMKMHTNGVTQLKMIEGLKAEGVTVSRAAFNAKLGGRSEFKVREFLAVMRVLGVEDFADYLTE